MRIPRCAPHWLLQTAQSMVNAGAQSKNITQTAWLDSWQMSLRWRQGPTFSALAYMTNGPFNDTMQMQLLDAFSRACKKKLVSIVDETPRSAVCFFGGVPDNIQLATLDFAKMDITKPRSL